MSKVSMPRPRYVAARIEAAAPVSRRALSSAIAAQAKALGLTGEAVPQLTRHEHPHFIVRADHAYVAAARHLLTTLVEVHESGKRLPVTVATTLTSGTLAALTATTGVLRERAPKPGEAGKSEGVRKSGPKGVRGGVTGGVTGGVNGDVSGHGKGGAKGDVGPAAASKASPSTRAASSSNARASPTSTASPKATPRGIAPAKT